MRELGTIAMPTERGAWKSMPKTIDGHELVALVWTDRNRKFSTSGSTAIGPPIERTRWQQTLCGAQKVTLTIPVPLLASNYFASCDTVDQHNRSRQDTLNIEKKFEVKSWDTRVNATLLGVLVVDAFKLYAGATTKTRDGNRILDVTGDRS